MRLAFFFQNSHLKNEEAAKFFFRRIEHTLNFSKLIMPRTLVEILLYRVLQSWLGRVTAVCLGGRMVMFSTLSSQGKCNEIKQQGSKI